MQIKSLFAREILDSRGTPTIEVKLETAKGVFFASVASGTSTGQYEAVELRDGEKRFCGKGVQKAIYNIEKVIAPVLLNKNFFNQNEIDLALIKFDGTKNKSKLGANAILAVSMAACRAFACETNQELFAFLQKVEGLPLQEWKGRPSTKMPIPCFNVLEGGRHAGNNLETQEFLIVPFLNSFKENLQAASEIYYYLKLVLVKNFGDIAMNTGYESGFAPPLKKAEQALDLLMQAIKQAGYEKKVKIGLDIAASELYHNGKYKINGKLKNPDKLFAYYEKLFQKYPILFLEDPFGENDLENWQKISASKGRAPGLIVGDDLTVTNPERIKMAKEKELCNGLIVKLNQIGAVSETIAAAKLAKGFGWKIIVSHRSGETNDDFIADLAVGLGADFIKTGAPAGGERVAKYNRLLEIERTGSSLTTS